MFGGIAVAKNLLCVASADARGRVFLVDLDERRVVSSWEFGPLDGGYADAGGVAMTPDFTILVPDTRNDVVRRFTAFGKEIGTLGTVPDRAPGAASRDRTGVLDRPRAVAVAGALIFVACGERALRRGVQRFRKDGTVMQPLRAFGEAEQLFGAPRGVYADMQGVLVADTLHGAVQRFDSAGRFIGHFETSVAPGTTSRPVALVRLNDGDILVADQGDRCELARFAPDGQSRPMPALDLEEPTGLARDDKGRIYVLDRDGERVQRLMPDLRMESQIVNVAELAGD